MDRATLRPLSVHVRTSVDLGREEEDASSGYEEILYRFRWSDLPP